MKLHVSLSVVNSENACELVVAVLKGNNGAVEDGVGGLTVAVSLLYHDMISLDNGVCIVAPNYVLAALRLVLPGDIGDAGEDITENIINDTGVQIILLVPDTKEYGRTRSAMANEIYDVMQTNYGGNTMFAVVAGNYNTASEWADEVRAHYPVYTAEDTDIKILARGKGARTSKSKNGRLKRLSNLTKRKK